jgi:riboflavin synthase
LEKVPPPGVSLTLAEISASWFAVEIIPHTLASTNLQFLRIGQRVNVELDLIGKYLYSFQKNR